MLPIDRGAGVRGPNDELFSDYYSAWLEELRQVLLQLMEVLENPEPEPRQEARLGYMVHKFAEHYSSYYMAKHDAANESVLEVLANPSWKSPLEAAFMWLGGWRPSLVFRLAYALAGQEIEAELAELISGIDTPTRATVSAGQLESISELQIRVQENEDDLTHRLAKLQQGMADQPLVGLVVATVGASDERGEEEAVDRAANVVEKSVDHKLEQMKRLLAEADGLRFAALQGLIGILTIAQAAHFLVVAALLQFAYRDISTKKMTNV